MSVLYMSVITRGVLHVEGKLDWLLQFEVQSIGQLTLLPGFLVEECRNTQSAVCKDHLSLFPILQSNRLLYESLEDTQSKMATARTVIGSDKLQLVLLIGEKYGSSVYLLSVCAD